MIPQHAVSGIPSRSRCVLAPLETQATERQAGVPLFPGSPLTNRVKIMDSEEQHFLRLIEQEKRKMRPELTGEEIDKIENEIMRLQGLLERYRKSRGERSLD